MSSSPVEVEAAPGSVDATPFFDTNTTSPNTTAPLMERDLSLVAQYQDLSTVTAVLTGFALSAAFVVALLLCHLLLVRGALACARRCCTCRRERTRQRGSELYGVQATTGTDALLNPAWPLPQLDLRTRFVNMWTNTVFPYVMVRTVCV